MFHKSMSTIFHISVLRNAVAELFGCCSLLSTCYSLLFPRCSFFLSPSLLLLLVFCYLLLAARQLLLVVCLCQVNSIFFPLFSFLLTLLFLLINFNVVLLLCVITSGKNMITRNYFLLIHCILSIKIFKTFITTHHKHEESVSLLLNGKIP